MAYITEDVNSSNIENVDSALGLHDLVLYFRDGTVHEYQYDYDKSNIYYIVLDSEGSVIKKIELCNKVEDFGVSYDENNKYINIYLSIDGFEYRNNFTVK